LSGADEVSGWWSHGTSAIHDEGDDGLTKLYA